MGKIKKNNIIPQLCDVRSANGSGLLEATKRQEIRRILPIRQLRKNVTKTTLGRPKIVRFSERRLPMAVPDYALVERDRFKAMINKEKTILETRKQTEYLAVPDVTNVKDVRVEFQTNAQDLIEELPRTINKKPLKEAVWDDNEFFIQHGKETIPVDEEKPRRTTWSAKPRIYIENELDRKSSPVSAAVPKEIDRPRLAEIPKKEKVRNKSRNGLKKGSPVASKATEQSRPSSSLSSALLRRKAMRSFGITAFLLLAVFFGLGSIEQGLRVKNGAMIGSEKALASLYSAKDQVKRKDFQQASVRFNDAYDRFDEISKDVNGLGVILVETSKYIPYLSKLSSGKNLVEAGKNISQAGVLITNTLDKLSGLKDASKSDQSVSYLEVFQEVDGNLKEISSLLEKTEENLAKVNIEDIPDDKRESFVQIKEKLPEINDVLAEFTEDEKILTDILGGNGPRKYLLLFQNNQEMRATGGFIGSYALLDIFNGQVRKFFVDGIFNPDGQLTERIVPPGPIQKVSANWSLHDSNWFPDFPKSAEKAMWFYEKTGGPTVDGIITMTPEVLGKLLEVTGPIEMADYGATVDKDNYLEILQYEVEVDYDKELNQPKQILNDLAPVILDRIFNSQNVSTVAKTMNILLESLQEKQILIYSRNWDIQKRLSERGWTGEILKADKDYLSVINTNINGYKTDGVVEETITHHSEIQSNGEIINTVTIKKKHNGGDTPYDWWNRVNSSYLRVYVPQGSQFLSVSGHTRELQKPPLDYKALGYKQDPQLKMEEDSMEIDEATGTIVYEDSGKTVFANWVYVSPKEEIEVIYKYKLPFQLSIGQNDQAIGTYSLLAQKQSGSRGSGFTHSITYPAAYKTLWKYPGETMGEISDLPENQAGLIVKTNLQSDKFFGIAFSQD